MLFTGWGSVRSVFPSRAGNWANPRWERIGKELKELLSEEEYATASRVTQYAHYTSETVIRRMWELAERLGVGPGTSIFEPGMGVGHFAGFMPDSVFQGSMYRGIELDHVTAEIAGHLYPGYDISQGDLSQTVLPENSYDFVIGNPPFAGIRYRYGNMNLMLHDYVKWARTHNCENWVDSVRVSASYAPDQWKIGSLPRN